MKRILIVIFAFWAVGYGLSLTAQTRESALQQLMDEDRANMEALMLYPEATRLNIFEAAKYPEAIIRMQTMQARTQAAFRTLVESYPEYVQRQVWDLTRYPGLIDRLVGEGRGNRAAVNRILQDYPAEAREPAMQMSEEQFGLLSRIDGLERDADEAFRNFLMDYPERTRAALSGLVNEPEALGILADNMRMTVMLGDLYQRDPYWLIQQADSLHLTIARDRARDLDNWKQSIESDPEARRELEQSAQAYAQEYGYDDSYYNYAPVERPQRVVVEHHYYYPYRYWFGYPYWYTYPRWRPWPVWYDWGFYMRPGGTIMVFGFPSHYFVNWYYYRPVHVYRYPRVAGCFADFYYGPRRSNVSIVVGVDTWRRRNAAVVSDAWLSDRNGRVERLREFGQMEEARETYNRQNSGRQVNQREFVTRNTGNYPRLTEHLPAETQQTPPRTEPRRDRTTTQPEITPRTEPRREPAQTQPTPRRDAPRTQPETTPRTEPRRDPAQTQPTPRREAPRTQPETAPRTEPRREPAQTQPAPRRETPAPATTPAPRTDQRKKDSTNTSQFESNPARSPMMSSQAAPAPARQEPVRTQPAPRTETRTAPAPAPARTQQAPAPARQEPARTQPAPRTETRTAPAPARTQPAPRVEERRETTRTPAKTETRTRESGRNN